MCATDAGTRPSASSGTRSARAARPPNVRWSTKRSSRPPSVKREPRPAGASRPGASAGCTSSCPLMPRCATSAAVACRRAAATGTCRGGSPPRSCGPRSARGRGRRAPAGVATHGARVQHLGGGDGAARRPSGRGRAAPPRPRAARASGVRRSGRRRRPRAPRGAALLESSAYAVAAASCSASFLLRPVPVAVQVAADADPRARTPSAWSGPLSSTTYSGTPSPRAARELLQAGLPVQPGAERRPTSSISGSNSRWTSAVAVVEPAVEVDRADHRLDGVGQDRGLVASAGGLLAAAEQQVLARAAARAPTPASARALTTAARSLASWPSGRSGWVR